MPNDTQVKNGPMGVKDGSMGIKDWGAGETIGFPAAAILKNISDVMFQRDDNIITVFPLPNRLKLTDNITSITGIYYDNNNPKYNPNGQYIASSSSYADPKKKVFNIFNDANTNPWQCDFSKNPSYDPKTFSNPPCSQDPYTAIVPSTYQGGGQQSIKYKTIVGEGTKATTHIGEWVQIQLPYQIYLNEYSISTPLLKNKINSFPKKFTLVGSNDGNKWRYVHQRDLNTLPEPNGKPIVYKLNSTENFSYFRLIISEVADQQNVISISQWTMKGTLKQTYNDTNKGGVKEKFSIMREPQQPLEYCDLNKSYSHYIEDHLMALPYHRWNNVESFTTSDISNGLIGPISQQSVNYSNLLNKINSRYYDISNNINTITNAEGTGLHDKTMMNDMYDYQVSNPKPTLKDGVREDSVTMLTQQNYIFILGTICSVTLLVGAIVIARE